MIDITQEIIDGLNGETFTYQLEARQIFDQRPNSFPMVIVRNSGNSPRAIVTADSPLEQEALTTIMFQLDFYCDDLIDNNGDAVNRVDVANTLAQEVCDWMWEYKGLERNLSMPPTVVDDATIRLVVRFSGVIDRYGYIYRR